METQNIINDNAGPGTDTFYLQAKVKNLEDELHALCQHLGITFIPQSGYKAVKVSEFRVGFSKKKWYQFWK